MNICKTLLDVEGFLVNEILLLTFIECYKIDSDT